MNRKSSRQWCFDHGANELLSTAPNFIVRVFFTIHILVRSAPFVVPILPATGTFLPLSLSFPSSLSSRRSIFLSLTARRSLFSSFSNFHPQISSPLPILHSLPLSLSLPPYPSRSILFLHADPESLQTERTRNECVPPSQSNQQRSGEGGCRRRAGWGRRVPKADGGGG